MLVWASVHCVIACEAVIRPALTVGGPRRLPGGCGLRPACGVAIAHRVSWLHPLSGGRINALLLGLPHRRAWLLGVVVPTGHRSNAAAMLHSLGDLDLPRAVARTTSYHLTSSAVGKITRVTYY